MAKLIRFKDADWFGLAAIVAIGGGMAMFRQMAIVPRATVGICAAMPSPAWCAPRAAILWLQYQQLFGWLALFLGLIAFATGRRIPATLAVALGIAAVVNYNATAGIFGAALGLLAWIGLNTGRYGVGTK